MTQSYGWNLQRLQHPRNNNLLLYYAQKLGAQRINIKWRAWL